MKREPKNGEWWLCLTSSTMALYYADGEWWDSNDPRRRVGWSDVKPLHRMAVEAEGSTLTLDQIVDTVRRGGHADYEDLRLAVVAFDVLLARLDLPQNYEQLNKYMLAAGLPPRHYIGEDNDPDNPEAVEWFVKMKEVGGK